MHCPAHPAIQLAAQITCPLCAQDARRASYARQKADPLLVANRFAGTIVHSRGLRDALMQHIGEDWLDVAQRYIDEHRRTQCPTLQPLTISKQP